MRESKRPTIQKKQTNKQTKKQNKTKQKHILYPIAYVN